MSDTAIRFQGVGKSFKGKSVLENISFTVPRSQVYGILGENGAGKSTMLKMMAHLCLPDHGEIEVLGQEPSWKLYQHIAYLSDRAKWFANYTVEETLQFGASFYPDFQIEKAKELVDFFQLDKGLKAKEMSKGQEARLQFLLCFARDVKLMLLDEPFSGIDLMTREKMIELIIDGISERELTLVITTHEINEVEGLLNRVAFIKDKKIVIEGEVEKLRQEHGSLKELYRGVYA
ncbi:ABC transporter ATP-binding protein [Thermoactinomyces sp. DSM 45892]|uniref:ABC transporter ATP-binding protein n=1 Tax=Thermoactinomyces sp. DSM 45892 TaxID=1882753 RepID=UPI00089C8388|nr:ABC transporter ATP-binding protein [Thermoactinomyces sp. DSM 45892]SDY92921.1 ABC-2 type transport system ATP-binding protein [Thermoactinomyces sp. DSM 45892]